MHLHEGSVKGHFTERKKEKKAKHWAGVEPTTTRQIDALPTPTAAEKKITVICS